MYLKFDYGNGAVAYLPLDYLLIYSVSLTLEEFELDTPIIIVAERCLTPFRKMERLSISPSLCGV